MEIESYDEGVPCWVDVSSPDPQRAGEFYSSLFGWQVQEGPPEAGGYRIAEIRGKPVAGIGPQMNPAAPPAWTTYVNVANADGASGKTTANGGQVLAPPFDVLDVGRMGVFADPVGAVFAVWQPGVHKGAAVVNEPDAWCWSELVTTDVQRSIAFYSAVFGWGHETHGGGSPGPYGEYTEWQQGGRSIAGMLPKPPMMPAEVPPHWLVYFTATDTDRGAARIGELGGMVVLPPMDVEPGRITVAVDPTGATFGLITFNEGAMT